MKQPMNHTPVRLAVLAVLMLLLTAPFAWAQTATNTAAKAAEWNYAAFQKAVQESGRTFRTDEAGFMKVQERKVGALKNIESYLIGKFGFADPTVMKAFKAVPREFYHYNYQSKQDLVPVSYEDKAKPWAVGFGSALSDYLGQAYMTQLAAPKATDVVLEIGTGSGFQISLLSRIVKEAYSIEIIKPLGEGVAKVFKPLGYDNVQSRVGDGYFGWPEVKGGFDIIMVTCAAQYVPPALFEQLKPGGRLVIPIGQPFKRGQVLYLYTKDQQGKIRSRKDVGVYFIPMTGTMMKGKS